MFALSTLSILILSFVDDSTAAAGAVPTGGVDAGRSGDETVCIFKFAPKFSLTLDGEEFRLVDDMWHIKTSESGPPTSWGPISTRSDDWNELTFLRSSRIQDPKISFFKEPGKPLVVVTFLNYPSNDVTIRVEGGTVVFRGDLVAKTLTVDGDSSFEFGSVTSNTIKTQGIVTIHNAMDFRGADLEITFAGSVDLPSIKGLTSLAVKSGVLNIVGDIELTGDFIAEASFIQIRTRYINAGKSVAILAKWGLEQFVELDVTAPLIDVRSPKWLSSSQSSLTSSLHGISDVLVDGNALHSGDILRLRVSKARVPTRMVEDGDSEDDRLDSATTRSVDTHSKRRCIGLGASGDRAGCSS